MDKKIDQNRPDDNLEDLIDIDRYPLTDLMCDQGQALVAACRAEFTDSVSCLLPQFLRPQAIEQVLEDVEKLEKQAYLSDRYRSPYGVYNPIHDEALDQTAVSAHNAEQRRRVHYLANDQFHSNSAINRLYLSPLLTRFAAAVLEVPTIYPTADPLMCAPVSLHYQGSQLGWHCDTQEFTITVMFRPSEQGGEFQYFPLAGPRDANFNRVPEVLEGDMEGVCTVPFEAGDILLFRSANTLHRVTPTRGTKPRVLSVLHYEQTPGRMFDADWKKEVFGRAS